MSTYAEVISANPSFSAKRYAKRLPYVVIATGVAGLILILLFFVAPWFSSGEPATLASSAKLKSPTNVSALTLGTSSVSQTQSVTSNDGSSTQTVSDSYSFPLIWAIPVVGLFQVVLALLLWQNRVLSGLMSLLIRLSFLAAIVFELIFFASSYFLAFGAIKAAGGQIATYPVQGFWFSLLVTAIAAIVTLIIMPDLKWCWTLATNDMAREVRMGALRASRA